MGVDATAVTKFDAGEILKGYLQRVMDMNHWSESELARHVKVSQKTVNNIMNGVYNTKLGTCEKIARGLGVELWHILAEGHPDHGASQLLRNFLNSSDEGRTMILRTAEREAKLRHS